MRFWPFLLLFSAVASAQNQIAITMDDLPVASYSQNPQPDAVRAQQEITQKILATLRKHNAPSTGFVNEIKINTPGARDAYAALLQLWLDAGMDLGCHGYSHLYLSDVSLTAYEADFARGTVITPLLMQQAHKREHFYRYPYNDTGDTREKHVGFLAYLSVQGYDIAPMTLENDDWMYAALYDDALTKHDNALAGRLREGYLAANEKKIAFVEALAQREFHRAIPQVADLHVNRLNADTLDAMLTQFEHHGYKFIALDNALADSAYDTKDAYIGRGGVSWLQRWGPSLGVMNSYDGDPDPPQWVRDAFKNLATTH
jgi:peptidoglycan/xylan/chitin deacetylase (PgdA/CDA1 family)